MKKNLFLLLILMTGCIVPVKTESGPSATATPSPTAEAPTETRYQNDLFSLDVGSGVTLFENERPLGKGLTTPLPDSIVLLADTFMLTLTTFDVAEGQRLADVIDTHRPCANLGLGRPVTIGNVPAMMFSDAPCGLSGNTYFLAVHGRAGFRFLIEAADSFATIEKDVRPLLDSFTALGHAPSSMDIDHDGISFTYDPKWLGEVEIQQVPAAAQGSFDRPTPAHTWFGFVPPGVRRDFSSHWHLTREPQIIVFNPSDFGGFSIFDGQARQKIAQFQQILGDRPLEFAAEIPILPPAHANQILQVQVKWLDFGSGSGVRFVTALNQEAAPLTNNRLVYLFFGLTDDGLHAVTAVFPLTAAGLPATVEMTAAEYQTFIENYDAELATLSDRLNAAGSNDFNPPLFKLDALIRSITILPTDTDFPMLATDPQPGQLLNDSDLFATPTEGEPVGRLPAGKKVVVNGRSTDGRRVRILCADGSTGNCWVKTERVQLETLAEGPTETGDGQPAFGQAVQITAAADNPIYAAPEVSTGIGMLLAGETADIVGWDPTGLWFQISCPRPIGESCWVTTDPTFNQPSGFFAGEDVTGN